MGIIKVTIAIEGDFRNLNEFVDGLRELDYVSGEKPWAKTEQLLFRRSKGSGAQDVPVTLCSYNFHINATVLHSVVHGASRISTTISHAHSFCTRRALENTLSRMLSNAGTHYSTTPVI